MLAKTTKATDNSSPLFRPSQNNPLFNHPTRNKNIALKKRIDRMRSF
jgi:hypothetical protein